MVLKNCMDYLYIIGTILFTVYGQLIIKWRASLCETIPSSISDKAYFLIKFMFDPFLLSGFLSAFIASLFWVAVMTKFDLSFAYPFMSLSFVLVLILSAFLFSEPFTVNKVVGLVFIVIGVIISGRSL